MKKIKRIEKKDPYENVSITKISVRDFVDVKKLIIYSRFSIIGLTIFIFFLKSSLYKSLIQDVIVNDFLLWLFTFVISFVFVVIFILSLPCIYEIIKFIYNLIVNRTIGVDTYYDIVTFGEFVLKKIKNHLNEDFDYDDEYEDECYKEDNVVECEDNSQAENNLIYVDFTNKIEP